MATATITPAHVYIALGKILKHMEVAKDGTLPGNMGGKKYISAPALSEEVKRQLVANDLILLSNEEVISQEAIIHKDRLNIRVVVHGTYTFVSLQDQSQASISGTGDGLATGTAVSSNIASTNALKNALLRTLLVSEESVEEVSMNGSQGGEEKVSPTQRKLDKARVTSKPTASKSSARDKVRIEWIEAGKVDKDSVNGLVAQVKQEKPDLKGDGIFEEVISRLEKGAVG